MSGMGIVEALRIARDPIRYEAEEVITALAALAGVIDDLRAIHAPDDYRAASCKGCGVDTSENPIPWPCHQAELLGNPRVEMTVRWDG